MGVLNNISTVVSWQDYLDKVQILKYPTNAAPYTPILEIITDSSTHTFDLASVISGAISFDGTPVSVEIINPDVYSLKNITATINGADVDFDFEINDNVELLKLFPEGLNFIIDIYEPSYQNVFLSSNGLPEYAFEKEENGDLKDFSGSYTQDFLYVFKKFKVYENTLEGNIIAPEDDYPTVNDDKIVETYTDIILSEKNDATYLNTSLIPSEELPEELTERIEKVISGEITFSMPENTPFIEIQGILSTVSIGYETKSAFYLPLNEQITIEPLDDYSSITYSEGLSVEVNSWGISVTNNSMAENGFIRFSNEPEPEPTDNDEQEWWAMMIALGRA